MFLSPINMQGSTMSDLDALLNGQPIAQPASDPYLAQAQDEPPIMQEFMPDMRDLMRNQMAATNQAQQMYSSELARGRKRDFWDELAGNVLLPLSAKGLPGATQMALDASNKTLDEVKERRKGYIKNRDDQTQLLNNLAKTVKELDPNDLDNVIKRQTMNLQEKRFGEDVRQNQISNDLSSAKFKEDVRMNGEQTKQFDVKTAQEAKEHADNMAMRAQQLDLNRQELEQQKAAARAAGDAKKFATISDLISQNQAAQQQAAQQSINMRQKALELEQRDRINASEHVMSTKSQKMMPKNPGYKPQSAEEYLKRMGGNPGQSQGAAFDPSVLLKLMGAPSSDEIAAERARRAAARSQRR